MTLPLNDRQFAFWKLRRSGLPNVGIADRFRISRQAVSKALLAMDRRVEETLLSMAQANQIDVESLNAEKGVLFGRSVPFNAAAVVFVSADRGVQVWYEHEGDCGACSRYTRCIEFLWGYADELGIALTTTDDPTRMADELFAKLREMVCDASRGDDTGVPGLVPHAGIDADGSSGAAGYPDGRCIGRAGRSLPDRARLVEPPPQPAARRGDGLLVGGDGGLAPLR